ncbi:hypothetical protein F0562_027213 [Nyssa sinensis]|uniref:Uncharacterized protein n=1 Tax=Nyssa sinensis TaxID=561372 RepID=A0A5J5B2T3_9ASTE|nr:hypothetical protein F0562_027213 [Nyssa sinensis]
MEGCETLAVQMIERDVRAYMDDEHSNNGELQVDKEFWLGKQWKRTKQILGFRFSVRFTEATGKELSPLIVYCTFLRIGINKKIYAHKFGRNSKEHPFDHLDFGLLGGPLELIFNGRSWGKWCLYSDVSSQVEE